MWDAPDISHHHRPTADAVTSKPHSLRAHELPRDCCPRLGVSPTIPAMMPCSATESLTCVQHSAV
jgi:hypothetical protein